MTTRINVILETAIAKLPTRNRWSRRAIARYLGTQGLLGADKNTIAKWEVLLRVVKEYRERIPRDAKGNFLSGYSLDQYQFACIVKLSYLMTQIRSDLNGCNYLPIIAQTLANPEIQKRYFSFESWQNDIEDLAADCGECLGKRNRFRSRAWKSSELAELEQLYIRLLAGGDLPR